MRESHRPRLPAQGVVRGGRRFMPPPGRRISCGAYTRCVVKAPCFALHLRGDDPPSSPAEGWRQHRAPAAFAPFTYDSHLLLACRHEPESRVGFTPALPAKTVTNGAVMRHNEQTGRMVRMKVGQMAETSMTHQEAACTSTQTALAAGVNTSRLAHVGQSGLFFSQRKIRAAGAASPQERSEAAAWLGIVPQGVSHRPMLVWTTCASPLDFSADCWPSRS